MGNLTALLAAGMIAALAGCSSGPRKDELVPLNDERFVLGPDAFAFCGGLVEAWAQVRKLEDSRVGGILLPRHKTQLRLKLTPPSGASWKVWNAHVIVEHPKIAGHALKFAEHSYFDTADASTNVVQWQVEMEGFDPTDGLRVGLRPFHGCRAGEAPRWLALKRPEG